MQGDSSKTQELKAKKYEQCFIKTPSKKYVNVMMKQKKTVKFEQHVCTNVEMF